MMTWEVGEGACVMASVKISAALSRWAIMAHPDETKQVGTPTRVRDWLPVRRILQPLVER